MIRHVTGSRPSRDGRADHQVACQGRPPTPAAQSSRLPGNTIVERQQFPVGMITRSWRNDLAETGRTIRRTNLKLEAYELRGSLKIDFPPTAVMNP
jgi:hypothetical protein